MLTSLEQIRQDYFRRTNETKQIRRNSIVTGHFRHYNGVKIWIHEHERVAYVAVHKTTK